MVIALLVPTLALLKVPVPKTLTMSPDKTDDCAGTALRVTPVIALLPLYTFDTPVNPN